MADGINEHRDPEDRGSSLACTAPGCGYAMHQYRISGLDGAAHDAYWDSIWNSTHADQYDEHHAPDIAVSWELSACCSVCPDGIGDVEAVDGETIECKECNTTWDLRGENGHREEPEPTAPEDDARDALTDEQLRQQVIDEAGAHMDAGLAAAYADYHQEQAAKLGRGLLAEHFNIHPEEQQ